MLVTPLSPVPLRRLLGALLVACLLVGSLGACGGGGGGGAALPDAAGASDGATDGATDGGGDGDGAEELSPEDAMLKYAQCMREQGIDMPDPEPGTGIRLDAQGVDEAQLEEAEKACGHLMEQAVPDDGALREMPEEDKQAMLEMAQCMRDKGYDFPDPQFEGGRVTQRMGGADAGFDPEDPAFQADIEQCQTESGLDLGGLRPGTES